MSISRWLAAGGVLGSIAIGAMLRAAPNDIAPTAKKQTATAENNKAFHAKLLKIAAGYKAYGRVDDRNRWAPKLCALVPSRARFSKSDEAETHGEKLYFLFAKDRAAYMSVASTKSKTGQVIVKESWLPKETTHKRPKERRNDLKRDLGGAYVPYAKKGDKLYHADKLAGLYIMYKTDADTPGTDKGWVYGTLTADGKTVISAGRVASCMACHEDAPHGRLFGMK